MRGRVLGIAAMVALAVPAAPSHAQPTPVQRREDQSEALAKRRKGESLSIQEIERRVVPTMVGARYIGFVYDSDGAVYTLKFLRDGNVIWVLVDARSGMVLGRAGG